MYLSVSGNVILLYTSKYVSFIASADYAKVSLLKYFLKGVKFKSKGL